MDLNDMNANQKAVTKIKETLTPLDAAGDRDDRLAESRRFDLKTIARLYPCDITDASTTLETDAPPAWEQAFLADFRVTANIASACDAASVERAVVVERIVKSNSFRVKLALAEDEAIDRLEAAAWRRALDKSDRLLTYLLDNKRPEVYGKTVRSDDVLEAPSAAIAAGESEIR